MRPSNIRMYSRWQKLEEKMAKVRRTDKLGVAAVCLCLKEVGCAPSKSMEILPPQIPGSFPPLRRLCGHILEEFIPDVLPAAVAGIFRGWSHGSVWSIYISGTLVWEEVVLPVNGGVSLCVVAC